MSSPRDLTYFNFFKIIIYRYAFLIIYLSVHFIGDSSNFFFIKKKK